MAVKSSFKNMTLCLLAICIVCSALLGGMYALTKTPIDQALAQKNSAAIMEVLPETAAAVEEDRTIEMDGKSYVYNLAYDENGEVVGCAVNVSSDGFGGPIVIKVGFDRDGVIWNTKVLSQSETPGLGAKCKEPKFADQFRGFDPSANRLAVRKDGGDVDAITASTITSRAYTAGIATAVEVFRTIGRTPMPISSEECGECCCGTDAAASDENEIK